MLYITAEDFFNKVKALKKLPREEEIHCAIKKAEGDPEARERLMQSYLPMVAAYIQRAPEEFQTLETVYTCIRSLEEAVDRFDFLQNGETFAHHLSWRLRQCITKQIANRH